MTYTFIEPAGGTPPDPGRRSSQRTFSLISNVSVPGPAFDTARVSTCDSPAGTVTSISTGSTPMVGGGTPSPLIASVTSGSSGSLLEILKVPANGPSAGGVKVTPKLTLPPGGMVAELSAGTNSTASLVMEPTLSVPAPRFSIVRIRRRPAPSSTAPKSSPTDGEGSRSMSGTGRTVSSTGILRTGLSGSLLSISNQQKYDPTASVAASRITSTGCVPSTATVPATGSVDAHDWDGVIKKSSGAWPPFVIVRTSVTLCPCITVVLIESGATLIPGRKMPLPISSTVNSG